MIVSDLIAVSSGAKRFHKARSLLESIRRRWTYHRKAGSPLNDLHKLRYRIAVSTLKEILQEKVSEINTSLSSREMMKAPAREVLAWIYHDLHEPGPAQHNAFEKALTELMDLKGQGMRAAAHTFNLQCEIALRAKQGWFLVFNTLTVRPGEYLEVFSAESKAFATYIRKFDERVSAAAFGSVRRGKGEDYHSYLATVEEGGATGRLHIHVLHCAKQLPRHCRDPNIGQRHPRYREIDRLRELWPHGTSTPIAVRISPADAYGKIGWRWPLDRKTGIGLKTSSPMRVAGYLTKYITKSYASDKRSNYLWRVRKSQGLGRQLLWKICQKLSVRTLKRIAADPTIFGRINNRKIPPSLLRRECLRNLNQRSTRDISTWARDATPLPTLLQSARDLTRTTQRFNHGNSALMKKLDIADEATSEQARRELAAACKAIHDEYFTQTVAANTTQSPRAFVH